MYRLFPIFRGWPLQHWNPSEGNTDRGISEAIVIALFEFGKPNLASSWTSMSKEKGKGSGGAPDELEETKAKLLAKELELITERNNMRRIQERSHLIETHIDHLATASKEKIQKLEDIITFLNGWVKILHRSFEFFPAWTSVVSHNPIVWLHGRAVS